MESRQHLLNLTTVELVNMIIDLEEKVEQLEKENIQLHFILGKSDTKLIKIRQVIDGQL